jgi:N-acyl homoserine lactone hydrolase
MKLYCFRGGFLTFDQSIFTFSQGMGNAVEVPTLFFLIDHPKGKVLFETGLNPQIAIDAIAHWGERARTLKPRMDPDQAADRQLAKLGISADEIDFVVISSFLFDHCGGMTLFPRATFILQFQELQDAWWPDRRFTGGYTDVETLPTRNFKFRMLYNEDLDIFGDGTVVILSCPAHTRGEQALVVRLPQTGTIVLPAGVIPTRANFDQNIMTGTPRVSPVEVFRSMDRLRRIIVTESAMVIFHHDPEQWKTLKTPPEAYV